MDIDAHDAREARPERREGRAAATACIERGHCRPRVTCAIVIGLGSVDRDAQSLSKEVGNVREEPQPAEQRLASGPVDHQAVAVTASTIPCSSSQRSASMAALQPSPAAVIAWR